MLLVIDNYDSFVWNLVHEVEALGVRTRVARNDAISIDDAARAEAVLISPGPGAPADAGICVDLIRQAPPHLAIFGVCLGHQAIGEAFGAPVGPARRIVHGKTSAVTHSGDSVFAGLPSPIDVVRYHSLAVAFEGMPDDLVVTARSEDGEIMGLAHRTRPVHGVQFHPESYGSAHGRALIANFLTLAGLTSRAA